MSDRFNPAAVITDASGSNWGFGTTTALSLWVTGTVLALPTGSQVITGSVAVNNIVSVTGSVGIVTPLFVQGMAASGSAKVGNPVFVAGIDSSGSIRPWLHDGDGIAVVRSREEATFFVVVTGSQIGNNKSMTSVVNSVGSGVLIRVHGVWITNVQVSAITGIASLFEFRRITGHSAGTQVSSIDSSETSDVLSSNVTVRAGATVAGESSALIWRAYWSSDDWGPGTLDVEASEHSFQNMFPLLQFPLKIKPITLRAGEGLTVKHAANSTAGTFDIFVVFSQVTVP